MQGSGFHYETKKGGTMFGHMTNKLPVPYFEISVPLLQPCVNKQFQREHDRSDLFVFFENVNKEGML